MKNRRYHARVPKNGEFFLARAFGARDALCKPFSGGRAQKQRAREPVRLTLYSLSVFNDLFRIIFEGLQAQNSQESPKFSSLAPSELGRDFLHLSVLSRAQTAATCESVCSTPCSFRLYNNNAVLRAFQEIHLAYNYYTPVM